MSQTSILVADPGAYTMRFGMAGSFTPGFSMRNKSAATGNRPITEGIVTDWDGYRSVMASAAATAGVVPSQSLLMVTDSALSQPTSRWTLGEHMFEGLGFQGMFVKSEAECSLYRSGIGNGLVLSVGYEKSYAICVKDGHIVRPSLQTLPLGGTNLLSSFTSMMVEKGAALSYPAEEPTIHNYFVQNSFIAIDYEEAMEVAETTDELKKILRIGRVSYTLNSERFSISEQLFNPSMIGLTHAGLGKIAVDSVNTMDLSLRAGMYKSTALLGGFFDLENGRIRAEASIELAGSGIPPFVRGSTGYSNMAYTGASNFAGQPLFPQMVVTKQEYEESGPIIISQKCP
ncbi:putative Actin, non-muscle 6.2 [Blattamonas nauphoetae]|uniref:Actin, non-muscle 6.2 n=1 Tax=Blattamonas nauphoetae TaxID=2049346 RepID=A0ABQ9XME3_9EUKA|nr:putative Actin, non-muscle 6.2 [Blattamonas nauphoetae]